jgi:hypothetical protein
VTFPAAPVLRLLRRLPVRAANPGRRTGAVDVPRRAERGAAPGGDYERHSPGMARLPQSTSQWSAGSRRSAGQAAKAALAGPRNALPRAQAAVSEAEAPQAELARKSISDSLRPAWSSRRGRWADDRVLRGTPSRTDIDYDAFALPHKSIAAWLRGRIESGEFPAARSPARATSCRRPASRGRRPCGAIALLREGGRRDPARVARPAATLHRPASGSQACRHDRRTAPWPSISWARHAPGDGAY